MLIVGAKGFAKEVLEVCRQNDDLENLVFYDDINDEVGDKLYEKFPILKNLDEAQHYFNSVDNRFTLGVGNPILRKILYDKFTKLGGVAPTLMSTYAHIGAFGNLIGDACNIMQGTIITNDVFIGKGVLINLSCTIGHDSKLEDFVELCPDVNVSGECNIGTYTFIGTNSVILPGVQIGGNVIIGAGSTVTKDIPDNSLALGTPAKVIKQIEPIQL